MLGRQQLCAESTLPPILPLMERGNAATLARVPRLWGVVLLANLLDAPRFALDIGRASLEGSV